MEGWREKGAAGAGGRGVAGARAVFEGRVAGEGGAEHGGERGG